VVGFFILRGDLYAAMNWSELEYAGDVIVYTTDAEGKEIETNYGKYFIYNRDEGRCVPVGDVVHTYVE
jgi:hypothetical protein